MEINKITETTIGCAYKVINTLGPGFLEKVYENALAHEIYKSGLRVTQQCPIQVKYDGVIVGEYTADLLIEDQLIVELKTVKELDQTHMAQCINYLKATGKNVCLLIKFYKAQLEYKRIVHNLDETKCSQKVKST
jgi:GxxExxY protein